MATTTSERTTTERAAPVTAVARRLRPSDVVLAIWVGFALVTIVSGITGVVFEFHDDSIVSRRGVRWHPERAPAHVLRRRPDADRLRGSAVLAAGRATGSAARPTIGPPPSKNVGRRLARLPCRRVHADAAARPGRGRHALAASTSASSCCSASRRSSRSTTSCPSSAKFLHGGVYRASSLVGDVAGLVFLIGVVWAIVRRYVQRPYRIRIKTKPEHAVILTMFFVLAVTGFADRDVRIAARGTTGVREVVVHRLPAVGAGELGIGVAPRQAGTRCCGCVHVASFFVFLLDPAGHDAAPHVHVTAEHVPARPRPPQGRDASRCRTSWRPSSRRSAPRPSRTSPGSSCSTPTPARCAAAAPACARPTRPASRSIPARSC